MKGLRVATAVLGGKHNIMDQSTSSYRSSIASSNHLKRIVRRKEDDAVETTMIHRENNLRSRLHSHGSSSEKQPSVSSACSTKDRRRKEKPVSRSESPIVILLRTLFMRCFSTRRKRRTRSMTTKKTSDYNHQTRDDAYPHIPTNAHEMFCQLHSKSRRSLNAQSIAGSSDHSHSSVNRSPSRQFSRNSRARTTSLDTMPSTRKTTPPVIVVERSSEADPFWLS